MNVMEDFKYCNVCLITNVKMYSLSIPILNEAYSQFLQVTFDKYTQHVCFECASLLKKYQEFKHKCSTSYNLLKLIQTDNKQVTKQAIKSVNRSLHNLKSKLQVSPTIVYNDQYQLTKDCDDAAEKYFVDIKSELEDEVDSEHLMKIGNFPDSISENTNPAFRNNTAPEILFVETLRNKKQKDSTKKIKSKKKKIKPKIDIKQETNYTDDQYFSDLDDVPLVSLTKNNVTEDLSNTNAIDVNTDHGDENTQKPVKRSSGPKFDASYFEDYATVVLLTPEEAAKEVLLRKESSNYMNCQFKCELCYRGFEGAGTFNNHMKKHSSEYGHLECEYCHLRFPEQKFLYKHHFSCHKRKFYCKICPYTCFCTYQAKTHINLHKGKKYPCMECGEIFSMPNSLLMHKRVKHLTECVCELCGSTFATQRGLFSHKMLLHRQETNEGKGSKCEDCEVQFSTETAWKRHLVLSSKHTISNGCEYCGETFPSEEALKQHSKVHARRQAGRRGVARQSDAARCVCELCGKLFKKQCFLQYHQLSHSGERPFSCGECGKAFARAPSLAAHRAKHKPSTHRCHLCHKRFAFRSALNKHVKAHLGIRPHKCPICEKSFPNPCDVKMHVKYVHYKVPWPKRDRGKRGAEAAV